MRPALLVQAQYPQRKCLLNNGVDSVSVLTHFKPWRAGMLWPHHFPDCHLSGFIRLGWGMGIEQKNLVFRLLMTKFNSSFSSCCVKRQFSQGQCWNMNFPWDTEEMETSARMTNCGKESAVAGKGAHSRPALCKWGVQDVCSFHQPGVLLTRRFH